MRDEMYFDSNGNRVKLDTRYLEWCNAHKPGITTARKLEQERNKQQSITLMLCKIFMFLLCMFFAIEHIDIYSKSLPQIVEGMAVAVCLMFMGSCVIRIWRKKKYK